MSSRLRSGAVWALVLGVLVAIGVTTVVDFKVAFVLTVTLVGCTALVLPPGIWVAAAVTVAMTFKGLVSLGALPGLATYLDIPLAWGALVAAGLWARSPVSRRAQRHLRWLGALVFAVLVSWLFNRSEILRPFLHLSLIGEPFAIIGALLLAPPSARVRTFLARTMCVLVAVQVPLAFWQLHQYGIGDGVQGTLYRAGAGAHVMAAVAVLGAVWLLASQRRSLSPTILVLAAVLLSIPVLADAKQVLFALPAVAAVTWVRGGRIQFLAQAALVAAAFALLFFVNPLGNSAVYRVQQARHGHNGKLETARFVWHKVDAQPTSVVFGRGPAETVSRAAFMTTDLLLHKDSSLRSLHLKPAAIAIEAQASTVRAGDTGTSFNSGVSSMLGVFGDLGIFGAVVFAGLVLTVVSGLRRVASPASIAATAGWAMYLILGFVFDWWEQPPFTVFVAALTGLVLTSASPSPEVRG